MNAVIFSCAIQYSPYKVFALFQEAAQRVNLDITTISDKDMDMLLCSIYYLRMTDEWNKGIKTMCHRMMMECADARLLL